MQKREIAGEVNSGKNGEQCCMMNSGSRKEIFS